MELSDSNTDAVHIVVVALTQAGAELGAKIAADFPHAEVHGRSGRVAAADVWFDDTAAHMRELFSQRRPIIGVCATGILVRCLAPIIKSKDEEGAVIAVSEDGQEIVPVLGGHSAGANALARRLGVLLGGHAAITSATDNRYEVVLDDPPTGFVLANREHHKAFSAALLSGRQVAVVCDAPLEAPGWLASSALPFASGGDTNALEIRVTASDIEGSEERLVFHPKVLTVGVGCERDTPAEQVQALVQRSLVDASLSAHAVAGVFSVELKADEPAVLEAGKQFGHSARFFSPSQLEALTPRIPNPSDVVFREVGCHGVAEPSALLAAGNDAQLVVTKQKSARATCAVAMSPTVIRPGAVGRARGALAVVGIGPGDASMRSPAVSMAIASAHHVVGYRLYLDLVAELLTSQTRHDYELGEEADRVRHAIELAAGGANVALVCSGDAGIYAMASLVFEMLDDAQSNSWKTIDVQVAPGISALQVAAARVGAPLGHDFCAISLSDLLTPRAVIEERLRAACAGDFVIALYNPISKKRVATFERAMSILREHRGPRTVAVIAKNLGRRDELVSVLTLDELRAEDVDMLSTVLIGSTATRSFARTNGQYAYTPRGYRVALDREDALIPHEETES
ncbi:MAG: precorrin-3B C(17)-methyltransferase [Gammaproteobacteria bacterium]|nr:precorrin-3B C(17)-methyltransferase [Gammaproteobacteria bacterium]